MVLPQPAMWVRDGLESLLSSGDCPPSSLGPQSPCQPSLACLSCFISGFSSPTHPNSTFYLNVQNPPTVPWLGVLSGPLHILVLAQVSFSDFPLRSPDFVSMPPFNIVLGSLPGSVSAGNYRKALDTSDRPRASGSGLGLARRWCQGRLGAACSSPTRSHVLTQPGEHSPARTTLNEDPVRHLAWLPQFQFSILQNLGFGIRSPAGPSTQGFKQFLVCLAPPSRGQC